MFELGNKILEAKIAFLFLTIKIKILKAAI